MRSHMDIEIGLARKCSRTLFTLKRPFLNCFPPHPTRKIIFFSVCVCADGRKHILFTDCRCCWFVVGWSKGCCCVGTRKLEKILRIGFIFIAYCYSCVECVFNLVEWEKMNKYKFCWVAAQRSGHVRGVKWTIYANSHWETHTNVMPRSQRKL